MPDIFPTQYSILSAAALNQSISKSYGLTNTTCKLLIHNVSDTYLVESEHTKYVFKIYRDAHRKLDEILGEIELLNLLQEHGAKISYPVKDLAGNQFQSFDAAEGIRHGVLFSFAPGKVCYAFTRQQLECIGQEIARIHNITSSIQLKHYRKHYDVATTLMEPLKVISPAFNDLEQQYQYLILTAEKVSERIQNFDLNEFSYGYCHYDFFPKNFHFSNTDEITFFDFDFAGRGLLANDITSFYIHFFLEVHAGKISQEKADEHFQIFIDAYRSVRPLSQSEVNAIPYLGVAFWIFYLGFQYENFDDWSNFFFGPKYLIDRVALIKKWTDCYCKFPTALT